MVVQHKVVCGAVVGNVRTWNQHAGQRCYGDKVVVGAPSTRLSDQCLRESNWISKTPGSSISSCEVDQP